MFNVSANLPVDLRDYQGMVALFHGSLEVSSAGEFQSSPVELGENGSVTIDVNSFDICKKQSIELIGLSGCEMDDMDYGLCKSAMREGSNGSNSKIAFVVLKVSQPRF